jgi:glucose-1-phosphate thymidylyltransferase
MSRRGIILAGGAGTRLHPLTIVTCKQLLPVYDKPMIYYPLSVLMLAGIQEILIITTQHDQAAFKQLLGTGKQWGVRFDYAVQPAPGGIAQAFIIGADYLRGHPSCLVLGDNVLYGHGLSEALRRVNSSTQGATIFAYRVDDPQRYGVIEFGEHEEVISIEEKPQLPRSNWAGIGIYFYDEEAIDLVKDLKPSQRGELEIVDLNRLYLQKRRLNVERLGRGFAWFDSGTHDSLLEASEFVRVLQRRQGQLVCAPDEIAFHNGWINAAGLRELAAKMNKTEYSRRLLENLPT